MTLLETAIEGIRTARDFTNRMLAAVDSQDWFRVPEPPVTHIAWQVGHLAFAQYRLALERIRGSRPEDEALISTEFLTLFGRGSVPEADPTKYPSLEEIRHVFERVHQQVLRELPEFPEADWFSPPIKPHALFNRKIDALFWCARHEMVHAGQIGLLRRLLGRDPWW